MPGDFHQQQVTDRMPMRIVERFEVAQARYIKALCKPLRLLAAIAWRNRSSSKRRLGSLVRATALSTEIPKSIC
jgi:hypothetical protein